MSYSYILLQLDKNGILLSFINPPSYVYIYLQNWHNSHCLGGRLAATVGDRYFHHHLLGNFS